MSGYRRRYTGRDGRFPRQLYDEGKERLINEELEKKNDDEEVLKKVNQVADAARELSEELRRKVSPEEICANYEAITMDDVEAAMQISANLSIP